MGVNLKEFFFAFGKTGCVISIDGGKNWQFISDNGYYTFCAISGKLAGFVSNSGGRIARIELKAKS